jgi:hypothetical protein
VPEEIKTAGNDFWQSFSKNTDPDQRKQDWSGVEITPV